MKVLHIIPGFGGGISSFVKNLAIGNKNEKVIYDVLGFNKFPSEYVEIIEKQNGKCISLPSVRKHPLQMLAGYEAILQKGKYDVVHCHFSGYRGCLFKIYAHRSGVKRIVTHAHRTNDEKIGMLKNIAIALSRKLSCACSTDYMTCSKMAAEYIYGDMDIKGQPVIVIPNSVDTEKFLPDLTIDKKKMYQKELKLEKDEIVLGHIGRFNIQKNHIFLMKIAKELRNANIKFRLLLVGDGKLYNDIRNEIYQEHLENFVTLLGKRNDVEDLIKIFDVMLLPSLFEGLPTVVIESQAAGIPCLLSDKITEEANMDMGLVKFLSIDQVDGWIKEIINGSFKRISEEERLEKMREYGFTIEAMQKKYVNIFFEH